MNDDFGKLFEGLSKDSHMASYELLLRIEKQFLTRNVDEIAYSTVCGILEAFYEAHGFKVPRALSGGSPISQQVLGAPKTLTANEIIEQTRERWRLQFEAYRSQIMANRSHAIKKLAAKSFSLEGAETFGYAILNSEEKEILHKHIEEIRKIIDGSDLNDRKKNNLFSRLNDLSFEINKNGTTTDQFFAFASEAGFCMGDFASKAKPLFDEIKDILKIVAKARARQEKVQLPPGDEVLSLPAPKEI
jgi:hypothetical protein